MKNIHWLLFFFLCTPVAVQAEIKFSERAKHFAKGSAKLMFAGANAFLLKATLVDMYEELQMFGPALRKYMHEGKAAALRHELFWDGIRTASFGLVAYKCLKSSIYSFKKAFERETVTDPDVAS